MPVTFFSKDALVRRPTLSLLCQLRDRMVPLQPCPDDPVRTRPPLRPLCRALAGERRPPYTSDWPNLSQKGILFHLVLQVAPRNPEHLRSLRLDFLTFFESLTDHPFFDRV
jgi:hypothetical protein